MVCRLQEIIDAIKEGTGIDQVMIETTVAPGISLQFHSLEVWRFESFVGTSRDTAS